MNNSILIDRLKDLVNRVQNQNQKDPNVKTASSTIFDRINDQLKNVADKMGDETKAKEEMRRKLEEIRIENEKNPNEETAPPSIFESLDELIGGGSLSSDEFTFNLDNIGKPKKPTNNENVTLKAKLNTLQIQHRKELDKLVNDQQQELKKLQEQQQKEIEFLLNQ